MRKQLALALLTIICLSITTYAKETSYRPEYPYSDETFEELPAFPQDFYEIRQLFLTQQIPASRLNKSYYMQPEILTSWDYCSEKFYNHTYQNIGRYGLGFLPSRFDIYNFEIGDEITISTIAYASPGISLYQGLKLNVSSNEFFNVSAVKPADLHILFSPTYPVFKPGWSQQVEITIIPLKHEDLQFFVYEEKPDELIEQNWIETTNEKYVSGNSLLSLKTPRLRIYFHNEILENIEEKEENSLPPVYLFLYVVFMIFAIFLVGSQYAKRSRRHKKD